MYIKRHPVKPRANGCLCCPDPQLHADLDMVLAVGFGVCQVSKDGEHVYSEPGYGSDEKCMTLRKIEDLAKLEPMCDWQLVMDGPLHGETYQRHDDTGKWTCVECNDGFA